MHGTDTDTSRLGRTIAVAVAALTVLSMTTGVAAAAGSTDIGVSTTQGTLEPGDTTTVEVVLDSASGGVGSGQLQVSLTDPDVAEITGIELGTDPGSTTDPILAGDGSSVQAGYFLDDTADTGPVTVAVVTVEATAAGSTDVEVSGPPDIADGLLTFGDESGASYTLGDVGSTTLTVEEGPTPAAFEVSNLDAPDAATAGDVATVSAEVTNVGEQEGETDVGFRLDVDGDGLDAGDELATQSVTLDGGGSQVVEFDVDTTGVAPGTYDHGVFAGGASATDEITLSAAPEPPAGDATVSVEPSDAQVGTGATTTLDLVATGAGDGVGSFEATVTLSSPGAATITDASVPGLGGENVDVDVASDGSSATVSAFGLDADAPATLAQVTLEAAEVSSETSTDVTADVAVLSDPGGAEYGDVATESATLTVQPLTLDVSGVSASEDVVVRGETFSSSATVEVSGMGNLVTTRDVELRVDVDGNGNLESEETVATVTQTFGAGETVTVAFADVELPADALLGEVTVGVVAGESEATTTVTVSVPPLADDMAPPLDPDDDGVYEDTNGNGEVTFADVTALFENRDSTTATENPSLFDFNRNGAFNVADVQTLFAELTETMAP
jgi:hypothetical protein